jgi:predicted ATPase
MALSVNRFLGDGFYVLDEPEAALSPNRQLAMVARLHELVVRDSQFVIATHSPSIMAYPRQRSSCSMKTACARSRTKTSSTIA